MKSLWQRATLGSLVPADAESKAFLAKVKLDEFVFMEAKRARNPAHHAKFFAMLQKIYENQEHYKSVEHILVAFKEAIGHYDVIQTRHGQLHDYKSISFAAMGQDEFEEFYEKALDFVCSQVIPGLGREDLAREMEEFLR